MSATTDIDRLERRLGRLAVDTEAGSVDDYLDRARSLREDPGFQASLARIKAAANENRLVVLGLLDREESLCGCEIQAALGLSHATVSHHMDKLVQADLVQAEQRGKWKHYRLTDAGATLSP